MKRVLQNSIHPLSIAVALVAGNYAGIATAESLALEEIVVTAQKRAESLQDVPISVNAVGGDKMDDAGIENLKDLSAYVPNLKVTEGGLVPQLYIRGVGSGQNQGFEQSVGTYSDGIYAGRSLQSRGAFLDLERVEVLRGPQSILFGKNSIAGALSLVSAKPTEEFEGKVSLSHEPEYDQTEFNVAVSGAITDSLRARLALRDRQEGGYLENDNINKSVSEVDERAARTTLVWDASNDLEVTLKLERSEIEQDGRTFQVESMGVYPVAMDDLSLDDKTWSNEDNRLSFESDGVMLKLDYTLGGHTLTAVSGYSAYSYDEKDYDGDTAYIPLISMDMQEEFEQVSQEIRLVSPGGETVDYIVGAFYQASEQEYREDATLVVNGLVGTDLILARPFEQESDTWAVFAQATWNLSEALRVTAGLRYTEEEKEGLRVQDTFTTGGYLGTLDGVSVSDTPALAALAAGLTAGFNLQDHELDDKRDEEVLTPSFSVQYDFNEDTMLYASYSTGYKSGGFDARNTNAIMGTLPSGVPGGGDVFSFDEEEAETIELGAKMSLLDGTAELNAALFLTDYTDMQVSVFDGAFGFSVANAGEARVQGLELDGRWRATENLTLTGALAYLDFEWTDYPAAGCPTDTNTPATPSPLYAGNCDFTGKEGEQTPEWSASLSAQHVYPLGDTFELRSNLDVNFKDNHFTSGDMDRRQEQGGATRINARLALASSDDRWQVALVGKNLTDQVVRTFGSKVSLSGSGITSLMAPPRTVAVEGIFNF